MVFCISFAFVCSVFSHSLICSTEGLLFLHQHYWPGYFNLSFQIVYFTAAKMLNSLPFNAITNIFIPQLLVLVCHWLQISHLFLFFSNTVKMLNIQNEHFILVLFFWYVLYFKFHILSPFFNSCCKKCKISCHLATQYHRENIFVPALWVLVGPSLPEKIQDLADLGRML